MASEKGWQKLKLPIDFGEQHFIEDFLKLELNI